jgi:hypothetical protein
VIPSEAAAYPLSHCGTPDKKVDFAKMDSEIMIFSAYYRFRSSDTGGVGSAVLFNISILSSEGLI